MACSSIENDDYYSDTQTSATRRERQRSILPHCTDGKGFCTEFPRETSPRAFFRVHRRRLCGWDEFCPHKKPRWSLLWYNHYPLLMQVEAGIRDEEKEIKSGTMSLQTIQFPSNFLSQTFHSPLFSPNSSMERRQPPQFETDDMAIGFSLNVPSSGIAAMAVGPLGFRKQDIVLGRGTQHSQNPGNRRFYQGMCRHHGSHLRRTPLNIISFSRPSFDCSY